MLSDQNSVCISHLFHLLSHSFRLHFISLKYLTAVLAAYHFQIFSLASRFGSFRKATFLSIDKHIKVQADDVGNRCGRTAALRRR
jgi:hypothetical protein